MEPIPPDDRYPYGGYVNDSSPERTMLGETQWRWLEEQLADAAEIRLVVSSIQVIPEEHPFEAWARFPLERKRFFELLARSGANNVVLLSGDRNLGELSLLPEDDQLSPGYPVYELTSSPLTQLFPPVGGSWSEESNRHRISDGNFRYVNFGLVTVDWGGDDAMLSLELRDEQGGTVFRQLLPITLSQQK